MKYKDLFTELADIVVSAGNEIMKIYSGEIEVELKNDESPLTAADLAAHELISARLTEVEFEGQTIAVISEEAEIPVYEERRRWEAFWLIDPLDGTKEFIKKNGEFTVNIALIKNNCPYLGMVYLPVTRILYFGGESSGSYKADAGDVNLEKAEKLPLKIEREEGVLMVAGSRSHRSELFDTWAAKEAGRRGCKRFEVVTAGSSLKFCLAAEGIVDVYPRFGPTMEWDTAAAHAVAVGAGKRCLRPDGGRMEYNKAVMKNDGFIVV